VPRHGGADSGGGRSAGRGSNSDGGSSGGGYTSGGGAVRRHPEGRGGSGPDSAVASVPDYSRPRSGRPVAGYAVPRGNVVPGPRPGGDYNCCYLSPYRWYYDPWAFGTWGLGYIYDPFWWGYGGGYPGTFGYGYSGAGGYGYGYGYSGGGGGGGQDDYQGALRIKVKPREAKVRVDGYFVGTVDDFDGNFQKLRLDDGPHKVDLLLDGFNTLTFDVMIVEGQTVTYKGKMTQR
jgi:PEGA domain